MGEIIRGNTEGIPKKPHSLDAPPQGRGWRIFFVSSSSYDNPKHVVTGVGIGVGIVMGPLQGPQEP